MEDILINSRFTNEETINQIKAIFRPGNEYDLELQVSHNEFYLVPIKNTGNRTSNEYFFLQFRLKANHKADPNLVTIAITPQSNALFIALGSMFIMMVWIIILALTIGQKQWLPPAAYLAGIIMTGLIFLLYKNSNLLENQVISRLRTTLE